MNTLPVYVQSSPFTIYRNFSPTAKDILVSVVISRLQHLTLVTLLKNICKRPEISQVLFTFIQSLHSPTILASHRGFSVISNSKKDKNAMVTNVTYI